MMNYFGCPKCGHIGRLADMNEHPTRPMPTDLGFCPKCGGEVDEVISEAKVRELLTEYGEDADTFFAENLR